MTERQLVTDADAELMAHATESCVDWTQRLLATRAVAIEFVEAIHKHAKEVHFLTCPWCYQIVKKGDVFLAEFHGKKP